MMKKIFLIILILFSFFSTTAMFAQEVENISDCKTRKKYYSLTDNEDERRYLRFSLKKIKKPLTCQNSTGDIKELIDISRGGIGFSTSNSLGIGDIIPVRITYADVVIDAEVKVVRVDDNIAGAEFTNLEKSVRNKLLYLSIMLEADNNMLVTRFST